MICGSGACSTLLEQDAHVCCAEHWGQLPKDVRKAFYRLREQRSSGTESARLAYDAHVEKMRALLRAMA